MSNGEKGKHKRAGAIEAAKREIIYGEGRRGYGEGSKRTQWQQGQSGNPKGRPPNRLATSDHAMSDAVREATLASLEQKHKVSDGQGGEKEISRLEALVMRQHKAALEGNAKALEDSINRAERAEAERRRKIDEENARAERYQEICWAQIADAKAAGKPEPAFFVHPDDMVVEAGKPVEYIGPVGPQAQALIKDVVEARDLAIVQAAYEEKMFPNEDVKPQMERRQSACVFAHLINMRLPRRFQLSDWGMIWAFDRELRKTKRQLLKDLSAGWRKRGVRAARGQTLPPIGETVEVIDRLFALAREQRAEHKHRASAA